VSQDDIKYKKEFEVLFKKYFNPLFNYINHQLNNPEDSREVVQNTFLKIWNYRGKIELDSPAIKSYLYTTAKNTLIDFIRKRKRTISNTLDIEHSEGSMLAEDESPLSPFVIQEEILKAIEYLKPKTKKIFILNKFEGYTYKEIADHLQISKRAVEDNIARALVILREKLKDNPNLIR